jgi:rod shape-determining protein MreD
MKKAFKSSSGFGGSSFDSLGRLGLTVAIVFILIVLSAFPFPFAGLAEIRPAFLLIAVYYWAVFRPQMLSPAGAFAAGLALDLVSFHPPGLNALLLVVVQWLVRGQRKFLLGQNFIVIWTAFALVSFLAALLQWAVFSLLQLHLMAIRPVMGGALMTVVVFPLVAKPLFLVNRALERRPSLFK